MQYQELIRREAEPEDIIRVAKREHAHPDAVIVDGEIGGYDFMHCDRCDTVFDAEDETWGMVVQYAGADHLTLCEKCEATCTCDGCGCHLDSAIEHEIGPMSAWEVSTFEVDSYGGKYCTEGWYGKGCWDFWDDTDEEE